jgi:hypothetical protein
LSVHTISTPRDTISTLTSAFNQPSLGKVMSSMCPGKLASLSCALTTWYSLEGRHLSALGFVLVGVTPVAQLVGSNKGRLGECVVGKEGEVLIAQRFKVVMLKLLAHGADETTKSGKAQKKARVSDLVM